jgi:predicted ATP-dependent endonuclease of OLD family
LIEEPEIHLHPGAQYDLLDMFLESVDFGKHIIMTTHSKDLLEKVAKYAEIHTNGAEGHQNIEQVETYLLKKDAKGSTVTQKTPNSLGARVLQEMTHRAS